MPVEIGPYTVRSDDFTGNCWRINNILSQFASRIEVLERSQPAPRAFLAYGTENLLLLTTSFQTVTTLLVPMAGDYLVTGFFSFNVGEVGIFLQGGLSVSRGIEESALASFATVTVGSSIVVAQQWLIASAPKNTSLSLVARKSGGAGASSCYPPFTSISAIVLPV